MLCAHVILEDAGLSMETDDIVVGVVYTVEKKAIDDVDIIVVLESIVGTITHKNFKRL